MESGLHELAGPGRDPSPRPGQSASHSWEVTSGMLGQINVAGCWEWEAGMVAMGKKGEQKKQACKGVE